MEYVEKTAPISMVKALEIASSGCSSCGEIVFSMSLGLNQTKVSGLWCSACGLNYLAEGRSGNAS